MSGHTPGPWHVRCGAPLFAPGTTNIISTGGDYIAEVGHIDQEHVEADARLIATAPEMLAALREVEAHHVEQNRIKGRDEARSHTLNVVRAAIAKAVAP